MPDRLTPRPVQQPNPDDEETPRDGYAMPERAVRRRTDASSSNHVNERADAPTPDNGIKIDGKGVTFPWAKLAAFLVVGLNSFLTIGGISLAKSHGALADTFSQSDEKLNRILESSKRVETKVDRLEDRQRSVELDVATLKAHEEKDRPR